MPVDPSQPIPLYHQLKTHLLEQILAGKYEPGDRIPTEHELCEQLGISRTPVNRALSELADEGVILRQRKRGSFVNPHWVRRPAESPELRLLLPDGPWEALARRSTTDGVALNIASVQLEDLRQVVIRQVAEGRAPDLALVDSVWVPELASAGFLWPLEELDADWIELDYMSDFLEPLNEINAFEGRTYGIQAEADIAGLWYRRDHLDRLGEKPPRTWGELMGLSAAIRDLEGPEHLSIVMPGGGRAGEATTYCLLALLASNGARMISNRGISLDDSRTVATLRFLRLLISDGLMPTDVVGYDRERPAQLLAAGRASFMFGGSYQVGHLAELSNLPVGSVSQRFGFIPVPAGPDGAQAVLAGGMAYVIFRQADRPKAAMAYLEHLLSEQPLTELAEATGQIPPRRAASRKAAATIPFVAETAEMLVHAVIRPPIVEHARVSTQLQHMLASVLTGSLGPASATERTAEYIGAITGLQVIHGMIEPEHSGERRR